MKIVWGCWFDRTLIELPKISNYIYIIKYDYVIENVFLLYNSMRLLCYVIKKNISNQKTQQQSLDMTFFNKPTKVTLLCLLESMDRIQIKCSPCSLRIQTIWRPIKMRLQHWGYPIIIYLLSIAGQYLK